MIGFFYNQKNRKANHGLSFYCCLLIVLLFVTVSSLNAMIKEVTLNELVRKSDVIAIVDVLAVKEVETLPSGARVVANLVSINQPLMGETAIGDRLKIKTRTIEDNASLKKGMKVLLFLKKVENYYEVAYGIAGSWPVNDEGKIVGYGTGKSISDVENAIKLAKEEKESNPDASSDTKKSSDRIRISI